MMFTIYGKPVEIKESQKNFVKINNHISDLCNEALEEIDNYYKENFKHILSSRTYMERFINIYIEGRYFEKILKKYSAKVRQYIASYGIYDLSDMDVYNGSNFANYNSKSIQNLDNVYFKIVETYYDNEDDFDYSNKSLILEKISNFTAVDFLKTYFKKQEYEDALFADFCNYLEFAVDELTKRNCMEVWVAANDDVRKAQNLYANLIDGSVPENEVEAMVCKLIELDPTDAKYYKYIFKKHPKAKYEIVAIGTYIGYYMLDMVEDDLKNDFNLELIDNEDFALSEMERLEESMHKFGIEKSMVKTELEKILNDFDIQARTYDGVLFDSREKREKAKTDDALLCDLCGDLSNVDKDDCRRIIAEIKEKDCTPEIVKKHIANITERIKTIDCDFMESLLIGIDDKTENECNQLKDVINQYDAELENKKPYIERVDNRIYSIWDKEDTAKFEKIYMETVVGDVHQIERNTEYIRNNGRTDSKEKFIKALSALNENEIMSAAKYAVAKESGAIASFLNMGKKESYETLTVNGKVFHPAIVGAMQGLKEKKGNSIFSGLKKSKGLFGGGNGEFTNTNKFCTSCGAKIEVPAKFCSKCGNKLS